MGDSLLIRNTRRFRVTEVRLRAYQRGLAICAEMQNIEHPAECANNIGALSGHLRISCPMALGMSAIGPLVIAFVRKQASVSVTLRSTNR